jgi:hypothetical protein
MRLTDLRRFAIRSQASVRFLLAGGRECVVDHHGVARILGLDGPPAFHLEEELTRAERFVVTPVAGARVSRELSRSELEQLALPSKAAPAAADPEE